MKALKTFLTLLIILSITALIIWYRTPELYESKDFSKKVDEPHKLNRTHEYQLPSKGGYYLKISDTEQSKIYLVNVSAKFGKYDRNLWQYVEKGDTCVIISGVIRNDYDEDYYIPLSAVLYNSEGEKTGMVVQPERPDRFTVVHVKSGEIAIFKLYVLCNECDAVDYEVFIPFKPSKIPPP
ncbi:hypothetical protein GAH_00721 [Geoglobus ahangari]|uniref:Uncharacterized protein n=2 Tax=Geoglobus ahangari TaxID=113653 RepID=A0A0F7IIN9_9EURY|nr:hypothetical protein GAH_00721 [Geoglobus ahangari]